MESAFTIHYKCLIAGSEHEYIKHSKWIFKCSLATISVLTPFHKFIMGAAKTTYNGNTYI